MSGAPPKPLSGPQIIDIVKNLTNTFEARLELMDHQCIVLFARYNLLVDKGFTDAQALHLCTQDWNHAI